MKVAIVGGGIAGLSAGYFLSKNNIECEIFEAANELGGRVKSFYDQTNNQYIDNGQHLYSGAYHTFFEIIGDLKLNTYFDILDKINISYYSPNSHLHLYSKYFTGQLGFVASLLGSGLVTLSQIPKLLKFKNIIATYDFDRNCTAHSLICHFDTKLYQFLWEPFILATMNTNPKEASGYVFANLLNNTLFSNSHNSKFAIPNVHSSKIFEKIGDYIVEKGGKIHLKSKVNSIEMIENLIKINENDSDFDKFIIALPLNSIHKIDFKNNDNLQDLTKIKEDVEYSPIISMYLWYEGKIDFKSKMNALIGTLPQWIFPLSTNDNNTLLSVTISAADEVLKMKNSELINRVSEDISMVCPQLKYKKPFHQRIFREMAATFKSTPQFEKLREEFIFQKDNLIFCGDWTYAGLPATIETATLSGYRASQVLINQ